MSRKAIKPDFYTSWQDHKIPQGGRKLVDARNWCLVEELPYTQGTQALKAARSESPGGREWVQEQVQAMGSSRESIRQQKTSGALLYTLRVEDPTNQTAPPQLYKTYCPLYIHSPLSGSPSRWHLLTAARNHCSAAKLSVLRCILTCVHAVLRSV